MRTAFPKQLVSRLTVATLAGGWLFSACVVTETVPATDDDDSATSGNAASTGVGGPTGTGGGAATGPGATGPGSTGSGMPAAAPGGLCSCDADCPAVENHAGICIYGVCMTQASGSCSAAGSTAECNAGSRCWALDGVAAPLCWPDCASFTCGGACDSDGSCAPTAETNCDVSCGTACSCQPGDCAEGQTCVNGQCITDVVVGDGPGVGPGPTCSNLPVRACTGSNCGQLISFNPRVTPHYDDYPINGEGTSQYRSWIRRDLSMLLDYATALTLCKSADWDTGIGGALGFGDMSEQNGAIPGTAVGQPGHPEGTHVNGHDIDLAYYQIGQPNNYLRAICPHTEGNQDAYHCVGQPHILDVWRTAFFLGTMVETSNLRVIGVDGQAGPMIISAAQELCNTGWLGQTACSRLNRITYETTNTGAGWYYFHHHHAHISVCNGPCGNAVEPQPHELTITPGVFGQPIKQNPHRYGPLL